MTTVKDICDILDAFAPPVYQESYDNSGLLVGDLQMELTGVVFSLDITEAVIEDCLKKNANMIVAHHPIIFKGLKRLTGADYVQRTVLKAIKHNIALYASHTNLDSVVGGVNYKICEKLRLRNISILSEKQDDLLKLVTFVPADYTKKVHKALFSIGCGHIGAYDSCSFNLLGKGTFRALEGANPFVGDVGAFHEEREERIEVILPAHLQHKALAELRRVHPYEEVAYDIYALQNTNPTVGFGCVGLLEKAVPVEEFLIMLKEVFQLKVIKHTKLCKKQIEKVAVCGGSGSFLLKEAMASRADVFVSGDFKYHEYFDADNRIIIADIGHYESEYYSIEIFNELITKKIPNFATYFTDVNTNPVNYFL